MFSGIIAGRRPVKEVSSQPGGKKLVIDLQDLAQGIELGNSIAIDGVCLTAAVIAGTEVSFDVISETLKKTTLGNLKKGDDVNIERSLRAGDRIEGHFVQGHVFGLGTVIKKISSPDEFKLWIDAHEVAKYLVPVGSIAVNGVSLTIADVENSHFSVALIPTTLELTNLGSLEVGDSINLEPDIISRQIVHWLQARQASLQS